MRHTHTALAVHSYFEFKKRRPAYCIYAGNHSGHTRYLLLAAASSFSTPCSAVSCPWKSPHHPCPWGSFVDLPQHVGQGRRVFSYRSARRPWSPKPPQHEHLGSHAFPRLSRDHSRGLGSCGTQARKSSSCEADAAQAQRICYLELKPSFHWSLRCRRPPPAAAATATWTTPFAFPPAPASASAPAPAIATFVDASRTPDRPAASIQSTLPPTCTTTATALRRTSAAVPSAASVSTSVSTAAALRPLLADLLRLPQFQPNALAGRLAPQLDRQHHHG